MNFLKKVFFFLSCFLILLLNSAFADNIIFFDDFNDNILDTAKWTTVGNIVVEEDSLLKLQQLTTDNGGVIYSSPIDIDNKKLLTITTRSYFHYSNSYYYPRLELSFSPSMSNGIQNFGIAYKHYNGCYIPPDYTEDPMYGFYIYKSADTATPSNIAENFSSGTTEVWDQWFNEKIVYNPVSGFAQYYINDTFRTQYFVGQLTSSTQMKLLINTYGWFTDHYRYIDDISVSQSSASIVPLSSTFFLLGTGILGLAGLGWQRKRPKG